MDEIKRVNYYNHQLLTEDDFKTEQNYHTSMRRRHNKSLHTWGLSQDSDFEVKKNGNKKLNIMPGMALDNLGRDIILLSQQEIDLSQFVLSGANKEFDLAVAFTENETDIDDRQDIDKPTRFTEKPKFIIYGGEFSGGSIAGDIETKNVTMPLNGSVVPLAKVELENNGNIKNIEPSNRNLAGARVGTINHSQLIKDDGPNPHNTTAKDVGALSIKGGKISGKVEIIEGDLRVTNRKDSFAVRISSIRKTKSTGLLSRVQPSVGPGSQAQPAALAGISDLKGVAGIFAKSTTDFPAVLVEGSRGRIAMKITGTVAVDGKVFPGHTVEPFLNPDKTVQVGDVVKLKGNKIVNYKGDYNPIPLAEVTLADEDCDTSVIGIVDSKTGTETGADLNEIFVVTMGIFSQCKVDASKEPIKAGDLLTTSSNPGYAQKATSPKIGSIIGKALESFDNGTGYIPVFVNIQ